MMMFVRFGLIVACLFGVSVASHAETAVKAASADCFVAMDLESGTILQQEGVCDTRVSPHSTFKIALSLMGYDAGFLKDATHPELLYEERYKATVRKWKKNHHPQSWMRDSVVWYSQALTSELGENKFQKYLNSFDYGNKDATGDADQHNGLSRAWLGSSLKISPLEQVAFLRKLALKKLGVSDHAYAMTAQLLASGEMGDKADSWKLYGKTGTGYQLSDKATPNKNRQLGWFVGWITKDKRTVLFAQLIQDTERKAPMSAGKRAKYAAKKRLSKLLDMPPLVRAPKAVDTPTVPAAADATIAEVAKEQDKE